MKSQRAFIPHTANDDKVAEKERKEYVKRALEQLNEEVGVGSHADCPTEGDNEEEGTYFHDVKAGMDVEAGGELKG